VVAPDREVPLGMEQVILKAMAKEPEKRQQRVADLLAELDQVAATGRIEMVYAPAARSEPRIELAVERPAAQSRELLQALDEPVAPRRPRLALWAVAGLGVMLASGAAVTML